MAGFTETMQLKGKAEEDLYFSRQDRMLIEALHRARREGNAHPADAPDPGETPAGETSGARRPGP
jgi:hypothetical protein